VRPWHLAWIGLDHGAHAEKGTADTTLVRLCLTRPCGCPSHFLPLPHASGGTSLHPTASDTTRKAGKKTKPRHDGTSTDAAMRDSGWEQRVQCSCLFLLSLDPWWPQIGWLRNHSPCRASGPVLAVSAGDSLTRLFWPFGFGLTGTALSFLSFTSAAALHRPAPSVDRAHSRPIAAVAVWRTPSAT
jgi:hypothetical protein